MVGFDDGSETQRHLNEQPDDKSEGALGRAWPVEGINANLTSRTDVGQARRLKENVGISFMGDTKVGPFDIDGATARQMLAQHNPHRKPNSDVVRPWVNGLDITRRPRGMWIIDFPPGMNEKDAAQYVSPFEYIKEHVKPMRATARSGDATGVPWWIHQRPRPDMRTAIEKQRRYLGTPNVTKHRLFVWLDRETLPDHQLIVFARSDDYFFGVLHSRAHEVWALRQGTQLESRPRYTPTTCFETFPFPQASDAQKAAIAAAAKELDELRNGWLNPKDIDELPEARVKKLTLTNLYNERPTWLANAHRDLDAAVFAAYGWRESPGELGDDAIIARLLALNLQREAVG
jgi:type II restriction/modification system DNA methylase subunit YeeA